jgi:hypothetical protein
MTPNTSAATGSTHSFADWQIADIGTDGRVITKVQDVVAVMAALDELALGRTSKGVRHRAYVILRMNDGRGFFVAVNTNGLSEAHQASELFLEPHAETNEIHIITRGNAAEILRLAKEPGMSFVHDARCARDTEWRPRDCEPLSIVEGDGDYTSDEKRYPLTPISPTDDRASGHAPAHVHRSHHADRRSCRQPVI